MRMPSISVFFAVLLLSSCGGVSGENGSAPFSSGSTSGTFNISLAILDQQCEAISEPIITAGETLCIQATLIQGANLVTGEIVRFSADLGSLSAESKLTDNNGVAQIFIESGSGDVGTASLSARFGDVTSQSNYEIIANEEIFTISLVILDQQCEAVTEAAFTAGKSLCVQATLRQGTNLLTGEIVSFSAGLGSLSVENKLTNSNGVAQIFIESDIGDVGAAVLSVNFGDVISENNYEFLAADTIVTPISTIDLTILKNGVVVNRFKANEQVQIQAIIRDENTKPIENVIVNFTTGKGSLNTDDALTDVFGIAQVTITPSNTEIGAAVVSALTSVNDTELLASLNFEIQSPDSINEEIIRIGHFDADGVFVENEIGVSIADPQGNVEISAGATIGISLAVVDENDQRILNQTPITFTSHCTEDGFASIEQLVNTVNGEAFATYADISCAGGSGNDDVIFASIVVNNTTISITRAISILAESVGSIIFISAEPTQLVLQGTGGQNSQTISTLVFQVNGVLGNPLTQQNVNFLLNTVTGGLSIFPDSGVTNSQGQVSVRVTSGNVPTSVRVTAEIVTEDDISVLTQSDLLVVNTGLPDQNSFTLSTDNLNPEAHSISGQTVNIIARLGDTFNNPVPDGTSISFSTEGGVIESSCVTSNATCSVTWTSANPRVSDHRVTILATAIGHETLFDANGNNIFDDADGEPITDGTDSGFGVSAYGSIGFVDHSEAWRDDNENNSRDPAEIFLDYNNNGQFDAADLLFNGPQCSSVSTCGQGSANTLHVRKSLVLVASSSNALIDIIDESGETIFSNHQTASRPNLSINRGSGLNLKLSYSDTAVQPIASGSQINITSSAGNLAGQTSLVMPRTNSSGMRQANFTLTNDNDSSTPVDATITSTITSPSGIESSVIFQVTLN
jgi:hypothetical protein